MLGRAQYVSFSTYRKTGVPVDTPVWCAPLDDVLYVFSEASAGKMKRLRNSSQARLATCNYSGKLAGEWVAAAAYIVTDPTEVEQAKKAFTQKYGLIMRLTDLMSKLSGRYNKRAYIRIVSASSSE